MGEAKRRGSFEDRKRQSEIKKVEDEIIKDKVSKEILAFAKSKLPKPLNLEKFTDSIKISLKTKNYYAALMLALTLPDICCSIEDENRRSNGNKYAAWFELYVQDKYTSNIGRESEETVFLSGHECYALRCTFLHKGNNQISSEPILNKVEKKSHKIEFMAEMGSDKILVNGILLLKLETFCENIISGVELWTKLSVTKPHIAQRLRESPEIYTEGFSPIPGFFLRN